MKKIRAISASPGIAAGAAHVLSRVFAEVPHYFIQSDKISDEQARFFSAVEQVQQDLGALKGAKAHALADDLLETHMLIAGDTVFHKKVTLGIEEQLVNAEWAVHKVMKAYANTLQEAHDLNLRERAKDIHDVMLRLISCLKNEASLPAFAPEHPVIIVADTIFPSQLLQYPKEKILGIALEQGGKTSHAAIIARAFNIPMVVHAEGLLEEISEGDALVVDAHAGEVAVQVDDALVARYRKASDAEKDEKRRLEERIKTVAHCTRDGQPLRFEINVDVTEELESPACDFADGIGLFRTEFFLTDMPLHHSEETQLEVYSLLLSRMKGKPVTIRTMDMGGDKMPLSMQQPDEENPLLGCRGIRFALSNRKLLYEQFRMLIKASPKGNLRVLVPMISTVEELLETKELYREARESFGDAAPAAQDGKDPVQFGAMLEVPSLLYMLDDIAPHCDFWSIGTNDLLQYTMAADRSNSSIAYLYSYFQPAFLRALREIFYKSAEFSVPVSMCGEMASDMSSIALLIGAGLRNFSVVPSRLAPVIEHATAIRASEARILFEKAVASSSVAQVKTHVDAFLHDMGLPQDADAQGVKISASA